MWATTVAPLKLTAVGRSAQRRLLSVLFTTHSAGGSPHRITSVPTHGGDELMAAVVFQRVYVYYRWGWRSVGWDITACATKDETRQTHTLNHFLARAWRFQTLHYNAEVKKEAPTRPVGVNQICVRLHAYVFLTSLSYKYARSVIFSNTNVLLFVFT